MKPILVVPIIGPLLEDVKTQVLAAEKLGLKIELRLDLIKEDISCLSLKPWIVTCGQFEDKVNLFDSEFIDIDYKFFSKIHDKKDKNIIASYHNFDSTPDDLEALFNKIKQEAPGAYLYKIATYANSTLDALRMLIFLKKMHAQGERLLGVCMGPNGSCTRILSPVFQNPFTFAPIDLHQASAKGQITVEELKNIYFFDHLGPHTKIYALIGDPVDKSRGHIIHNAYFNEVGCNAVYVKLKIEKNEVCEFLNFAKELLIQGVAVTMPLKEEIVKYVDVQCAEPSINTLVLKNDNYKGYNLDVIACYELIKEKRSIKDKSIYILGSGGVGASLACFFKDKEAIITIFNRDERRGLKAAKSSSAKFCRYDQFDGCCDVLIQTTSVGMAPNFEASIIETNLIKPTSLVIEFISNPKETLFLRGAKERGCDTIDGDLILEKISYLQQKLWKISSHTCCHC